MLTFIVWVFAISGWGYAMYLHFHPKVIRETEFVSQEDEYIAHMEEFGVPLESATKQVKKMTFSELQKENKRLRKLNPDIKHS